MVQASKDRNCDDPADLLVRSMDWGIFVQRQVSPDLVMIRDVGFENVAEMGLAGHDDVIETLPPYRADQPFGVSVLSNQQLLAIRAVEQP